jgi:hypothetical protein
MDFELFRLPPVHAARMRQPRHGPARRRVAARGGVVSTPRPSWRLPGALLRGRRGWLALVGVLLAISSALQRRVCPATSRGHHPSTTSTRPSMPTWRVQA